MLIINGWSWGEAAKALGITGFIAAIAVALANLALSRKLAET